MKRGQASGVGVFRAARLPAASSGRRGYSSPSAARAAARSATIRS